MQRNLNVNWYEQNLTIKIILTSVFCRASIAIVYYIVYLSIYFSFQTSILQISSSYLTSIFKIIVPIKHSCNDAKYLDWKFICVSNDEMNNFKKLFNHYVLFWIGLYTFIFEYLHSEILFIYTFYILNFLGI